VSNGGPFLNFVAEFVRNFFDFVLESAPPVKADDEIDKGRLSFLPLPAHVALQFRLNLPGR
jgi:hypothetical protein